MKVELKPEFSTQMPDYCSAIAARGDYMEDSVVDNDIHTILKGVKTEGNCYDPRGNLEKIHERLIRRGHFGPYEHPQAFFAVEGISRVAMAQITRHRHISFDVQSMRYCSFEDSGVKIPPSFEEHDVDYIFEDYFIELLSFYEQMVRDGVPKEDARFVLPLGVKVNMTFSANSRSLMHFIDMRHAGDAQWEVRELAERVFEELKEWSPTTFETYEEYAKGSSKKAP